MRTRPRPSGFEARSARILAVVLSLGALGALAACSEGGDPTGPGSSDTGTTGAAWLDVSVGDRLVCGITADHRAHCWGSGWYGRLGNGRTCISGPGCGHWPGIARRPTPVVGDHRFSQVFAGRYGPSCGLEMNGTVLCWGEGSFGPPLGTSSDPGAGHPRMVPVPTAAVEIAGGGDHACALAAGGDVYCWGSNSYGQLGNGTAVDSDLPVAVSGGHSFTSIAVGNYHSCGITEQGVAMCWGEGSVLGTGYTGHSFTPVAVAGGRLFASVTASINRTCGLTPEGDAYCWGAGSLTPGPLPGGRRWSQVALGLGHGCGVEISGVGYCWGGDHDGELGDGYPDTQYLEPGVTIPQPVVGGHNFARIAAGGSASGGDTSCGVAIDGALYCWGSDAAGTLGDGGADESSAVPVRVLDPAPL